MSGSRGEQDMKYTKFSRMGKSAYRVWAANMTDYEDMTLAEGGTILSKLSPQQRTQLHDFGQCELSDAQTKELSSMLAARSLPEQLLIQQSIEKGTHYGYVKGKTYYTVSGSKIVFGDYIILHSMGTPANMVFPLKLVSARNYYSTVGYNNNVEVVVTDANGVRYTLRDAHLYNPRKGEGEFTTPAVPGAASWDVQKRKPALAPPVPPILTAPPELAADVIGGGIGRTPTPAAPKRKPKPAARTTRKPKAKKPVKPAPDLPPILTAPPELAADVLGGGMGLTPTAAPKRKPAKPKAKKTAATPKLTPAQREYLAINGFVRVKRGGKYVTVTG